MRDPGFRMNARWRASAVLLSALALVAGCGSPGGMLFGPERNPLLDAARAVRQPEASALPRELEKQPLPRYVVEPGDVLLILPADPDSPVRVAADQPVLLDGTINLGRYGHLQVAGRTVEEIEALVRAQVEAQTKDAGFISVRLVGRQSKVYYVLGEVNSPGAFPLAGRETVLDGLVAAGGITDRASRKKIILTRPTPPHGCRVVLPICYEEVIQLGDTTTNYQLQPGDRIFVASRTWCENLFGEKKECPPCGGAQHPCPIPPLGPGCAPAGEREPVGMGKMAAPELPRPRPTEVSPPVDKP